MLKYIVILLSLLFLVVACNQNHPTKKTGNVIFIHPDGTGVTDWNVTRLIYYGPDGELNWDKMSNMAVYKSHMKNAVTASSHAGATIHSYGVKVIRDSFGMDGKEPVTSASGKNKSIMHEAIDAGMKTALINSGSIIEPGTAVFVASTPSRGMYDEITKQVVESNVDIILSGGEECFLPIGVKGFHVESGIRKDGLNLIKLAIEKGYKVVYNRDQLLALDNSTEKVLGVFSENHTFNDLTEEELKEKGLPNYNEDAPTLAEMTKKSIDILSKTGKQFFMVVEEEGTDNFANHTNANGSLEALKRADDAIGVVREYMKSNPNTLLVTTADSEAGGMEILGPEIENFDPETITQLKDPQGGEIDGVEGTATKYFFTAPDQFGQKLPFRITWAQGGDGYGGVLAKADGLNADKLHGTIDNTYIYRIMYLTLFGKEIK